jgi:catabolite regulation protein CreA
MDGPYLYMWCVFVHFICCRYLTTHIPGLEVASQERGSRKKGEERFNERLSLEWEEASLLRDYDFLFDFNLLSRARQRINDNSG